MSARRYSHNGSEKGEVNVKIRIKTADGVLSNERAAGEKGKGEIRVSSKINVEI